MRRVIRANPDYYRSLLSQVEFAAIVDWRALERGMFSKAIGRRGAPSALARRIQQLRALEIAPPPPAPPPLETQLPSPSPQVQVLDPPSMTELLMADSEAEVEVEEVEIQQVVQGVQGVLARGVEVEIVEQQTRHAPSTVAAAATSYIQKVGAAASQFMLTMSSATTDFVQQAASASTSTPSSAPVAQCPICFDNVRDPYMGRCSHVYCKGCLLNPQMRTEVISEYGNIEALRVRKCPQCRRENVSFYKVL